MAQSNSFGRYIDADNEPTKTLLPIEGYEKKPLVSLREALAFIDTPIHNLNTMVWAAERNSENPADGLTSDESAAIHLYTMEWPKDHASFYALLNQKLRSEIRNDLAPWFSYLKLFLTALHKLPSEKQIVWRGIRNDASHLYRKDFIWWGVSSCTDTMKVMEKFVGQSGVRTMFMIECINGKAIRSHSHYGTENEIILMPGTYLRVVDKCSPGDGLHIIRLQEETPPCQLVTRPFTNSSSSTVDTPPLTKLTISTADSSPKYSASKQSKDKAWLYRPYHSDGTIKRIVELEPKLKNPPGNVDVNIFDRVHGSLLGLAIGDALGASIEHQSREYLVRNPVTDLQGGGTWGLKRGEFTDDTSMALCLANSLIACGDFNPYDQLVRYKWWFRNGYMSSNGKCFDIGTATKRSLIEFEYRQKEFMKKNDIPEKDIDYLHDPVLLHEFNVDCSEKGTAGNGALMRLCPVPLFFYRHPLYAVEFSGISGRITHGDIIAYDACRYYGALIVATLAGESKSDLLDSDFYVKHQAWFNNKPLHKSVMQVIEGSYKRPGGYEDGIRGTGYIINALEAALWAFWADDNCFEKGVLAAVNLGDITTTTAAVYGQLAGAYYGYSRLPKHLYKHIYGSKYIACLSEWIVYESERWNSSRSQALTIHKFPYS